MTTASVQLSTGGRPSIVEELDEAASCSASDSGSMNDVTSAKNKKKKSFFHFKRKKEKKAEM